MTEYRVVVSVFVEAEAEAYAIEKAKSDIKAGTAKFVVDSVKE
jgi:hypothetical protein